MADRPHVPKFGNWEGEENVPYTVYFDKARKGRTGGKMINPNDPEENPDMFRNIASPAQAPPSRAEPEERLGRGAVRPAHELRTSREDGDLKQFTESPARNDNVRRRVSGDSFQRQGGRGSSGGRPARQSAGSEHSIERSPLHPHYQAKIVGRGSASPGWEGRNVYDSSHGTPGRSRMKSGGRADETPDRSAAVPKFGEWDENNPASADGYTHIFNRVREERHAEAGKSPGVGNEPSYSYPNKAKQSTDVNVKGENVHHLEGIPSKLQENTIQNSPGSVAAFHGVESEDLELLDNVIGHVGHVYSPGRLFPKYAELPYD